MLLVLGLVCFCTTASFAAADYIWIEGETPTVNRMHRHPWYDQVTKELFSGGDFISNFHKDEPGEAEYRFSVAQAGDYEFWVRANPLSAKLSYRLNDGPETPIGLSQEKIDELNVAADAKPDLRFLAWSRAGKVSLKSGTNTIRFRMSSENSNHGYLDCFVFARSPFAPAGKLKPDQVAANAALADAERQDWFPFIAARDEFKQDCLLDLRHLNEAFAGEHGFITVKDGNFVRSGDGQPVRFWAVNGPPHDLRGEALQRCARMLAKRGVNMVRIHGGLFDDKGEVSFDKVHHAFEMVEALKREGIYTHFSIYFPLWLRPGANNTWLKGYDGKQHPFAALFFNPGFQEQYRRWWTALLTTKNPRTGKTLVEEPAVAGLEIQNEDSLFFWTFADRNIPEPQLTLLEKMFGDWVVRKHGSIEAAMAKWNNLKVKRDAPDQGRLAFRPLYNIFNEKTLRDQDTAAFLFELQTRFYSETYAFLRKLGFKGVINASNWSTASPEVFGPLEKLSYTTCDFIDRHGYFSCNHDGDNSAWSIREGHTYADRSAYRFDAEQHGKPRQFVHPLMDVHYDGKPSMISETTWNRPNRYRSEAPLYAAVYGALQHSDAIVHFVLDGAEWTVKPGFWTQPWTLMSPAMMGQFPAAALIFRQGLVRTGETMAYIALNKADLLRLKGTPLPQDAALDELRQQDLPKDATVKPGQRLDPLLHYVGRTDVVFTNGASSTTLRNAAEFIRHDQKTVQSSTKEVLLDYGRGLLTLNAPHAQGISGALTNREAIETQDFVFKSGMELGHIVMASLDGQPLAQSRKMLLQVMSEEKPNGFTTMAAEKDTRRITKLGSDPWMVRRLNGSILFKGERTTSVKVLALDPNGYPAKELPFTDNLTLDPGTLYYLITR